MAHQKRCSIYLTSLGPFNEGGDPMVLEFEEMAQVDGMDRLFSALARNPGILIADDMGLILALLKIELESHGFKVWLASDGQEAIELYQQHRDEIHLVLLDVDMPVQDGPHTLVALRELTPDLPACFMTGFSLHYTDSDLLAAGALRVFHKPFLLAEVVEYFLFLRKLLRSCPDAPIRSLPRPRRDLLLRGNRD